MENIKIYAFADEASPKIDNQIKAMLRNNLDGLEIRGVDGENISDISLNKAKKVRDKLDMSGLRCRSIGSPLGKIGIKDKFEAHLDKFKHTLELADILGAENIRMFSFFMPKGENFDVYKDEVFERLQKFCELVRGSGVTLCHENEKGIYGDIPDRCLEIHKAFPGIRGVFDPANFVQCGVNTLAAWDMLKSHIKYLHIKDALPEGFVVPAGKGAGNLKAIVADYMARGGNCFTIEPHLKVFEGLAALEQDAKSAVGKYEYKSGDEAFDVACKAFKELI